MTLKATSDEQCVINQRLRRGRRHCGPRLRWALASAVFFIYQEQERPRTFTIVIEMHPRRRTAVYSSTYVVDVRSCSFVQHIKDNPYSPSMMHRRYGYCRYYRGRTSLPPITSSRSAGLPKGFRSDVPIGCDTGTTDDTSDYKRGALHP